MPKVHDRMRAPRAEADEFKGTQAAADTTGGVLAIQIYLQAFKHMTLKDGNIYTVYLWDDDLIARLISQLHKHVTQVTLHRVTQ